MHSSLQLVSDEQNAPAPDPNLGAQALEKSGRSCILAYHEVVPDNARYLYSVTSHQLEEHLRLVAELQAIPNLTGAAPRVTFDDGHLSIYQYALPLLAQTRVPATFFVTAGWIGQRADFLTWEHLREAITLGNRIQSHGWSHKFLTQCSESELRDELERSRRTLEDKLGVEVDAISAPGGRWNRRMLVAATSAGYRRVYLSDPWRKPAELDGVQVFGRLMVWRTMQAEQLRHWLMMKGTSLFYHRTQERLKESVRRVLGDRVYHRLWCWLALWNETEKRESA
jgi:peptidoglycan/xylan/chitin deacetylase (PgdA/CDA1 family)